MHQYSTSNFIQRCARRFYHGQGKVLPFEAIPGPRPLPFVGNTWRYLPGIGDYDISDLYKNAQINRSKYGPLVREEINRKHIILHLFDPNDIEAFFRQDSNQPYRRSHRALLKLRQENPERYNDGGIFPENGANWHRIRRIFNQYLMKEAIINLRFKLLDNVAKQTVDLVREQQSALASDFELANFEKYLYRWGVQCGLAVFLDYSNSDMPNDAILDRIIECSNDQLESLAGTEIKSDKWIKNPNKCPFYQKLLMEEDFMYNFVHERVKHLVKTKSASEVSLVKDWLVRDNLDYKDVITFLIDCITANLHTTVYSCMFLLKNISGLDALSREKLQGEILKALPEDIIDDEIVSNTHNRIPFLKDCFRETLRMHPVSIGTGRLSQRDIIIRNFRIPKDVMILAHNQIISRDPSIYSEPHKFQPNRWSEYRCASKSNRPSAFAWLPFGFGPRKCIGQRLVSLQIQILTIRILQKVELTFVNEIKTKTTLVHHLEDGIEVKIRSLKG